MARAIIIRGRSNPMTGGALVERGISKGPEVARLLRQVETQWIAEGFPDTAVELGQTLAALGCSYGQGYYYSRPLEPDAAWALIARLDAPCPAADRRCAGRAWDQQGPRGGAAAPPGRDAGYGQGYYYSRPLEPDAAWALIARQA
jgi:hypothetical protein